MTEYAHNTSTLVTLVAETCCNCGMAFAMSADWRQRRLDKKDNFYCPAGHPQHYTGESEAEKFKRLYEREQVAAQRAREATEREREEVARKRRQLSAAEGRITRVKNRVSAGVCPCCNRSFHALARHMKTKHPGYTGQDIG